MLEFSKDYFLEETRCGFFVDSMMKKFWAAQLEVLAEIDRVCEKYGLRYFADCGTLLGAIRHHGYIPWDDDMDIAIPREDYEVLVQVFKQEFDKDMVFFCKGNDSTPALSRIVNHDGIRWDKETLRKNHGCPYVAGIDIYVHDIMSDDEEIENSKQELLRLLYNTAADCEVDYNKTVMEEKISILNQNLGTDIRVDKDLRYNLLDLSHKICSMSAEEVTEYMTCYAILVGGKVGYRLKKEWYEPIRVPYENTTIPVPKNYHEVLLLEFDEEYMLPKRGLSMHNYPVYKSQQVILENYAKQNGLRMEDILQESN